jgi:hypothetical protein
MPSSFSSSVVASAVLLNRTLSCAALATFAFVSTAHAAKDAEEPPPIPPIAAVVDMGLVKQNKYVNCRDGTYSAMVGKRAVWTFNDTCLSAGGVLGDQFIDNTLAWNTNLDASNGITLNRDKKDADGVPVRFVPLTAKEIAVNAQYAPNEIAIWPGQLVDDPARQRELIFYGAVFRGSDIGFHGIGGGIAVADPSFTKVIRPAQSVDPKAKEPSYMWQAGEVQYTSGYLKLGDMLYCYGGTGVGLSTYVHVARVPLADVLDKTKWTYWTGTEWSDQNQNLANIYIGGAAGDSLFWSDYLGVYVSVYQHFADNTVFYRVSNHPEGPWSDEAVMFVAAQGTDTSYAARVHNEYDENGGQTIYVTYVKNTGFLLQELPLTKVTFGPMPK